MDVVRLDSKHLYRLNHLASTEYRLHLLKASYPDKQRIVDIILIRGRLQEGDSVH